MYHVLSLVGPPGHGKTTLLHEPTSAYMSTMKCMKHVVERSSNSFFEIWDTPGLLLFKEDVIKCMRRCDAYLLVIKCSETVPERFETLVDSTPGIWILLATFPGNSDHLRAWAAEKEIPFCHVKESEDAWIAAECALEHVIPRIKSSYMRP